MHAEDKTIPVHLVLDLPAAKIALGIIVYDLASTGTGSLEIPIGTAPNASR